MPAFAAAECLKRRRRSGFAWRVSLPAAAALALFLAVHALTALRRSMHTTWDSEVAFSSDSGAMLKAPSRARQGGANAHGRPLSAHLEAVMRSVGRRQPGQQLQQAAQQQQQVSGSRAGVADARRSGGSVGHLGALLPQLPPAAAGQSTGSGAGAGSRSEAAGSPAPSRMLFVTFGNSAMWNFTHNWALAVQRLGLPFLVGALDAGTSERCAAAGLPHHNLWQPASGEGGGGGGGRRTAAAGAGQAGGDASFFRTDFKTFRSMGATKVQLTLSILEDSNSIDTVVVSDADTVWLRDPSDYFDQRPWVDWFISTDCLSHEVEDAWAPVHNQPRCGHIPDNIWGRAYNTGVFAVRNRPAALATLAAWRDLLLDPEHVTHKDESNQMFGITDQLALNMLLEEGNEWELHAAPEDARTTLHRGGTLRLHPLPVLLFPSGHVAFVQRLPWRHGAQPYVIHATFHRFSTDLSTYSKRGRFREFGLWFLDGPEYYAPPGARYLTYDNGVRQYIDRLAVERFGGAMPLFYKHMVAMSYQLAQFRDALAAARMLDRILVLPTSWCWCDYDWTPHVIERCKIRGSDLRMPFQCPADFPFVIPLMDTHPGLDYRLPGFLEDARVPAEVRSSRADIWVGGAASQGSPDAHSATAAAVLPLGASQQQLLQVARPVEDAAVLQLRRMQPGLIRGFESSEDSRAFDALYSNITDQLYWCCAAEDNTETAVFWYQLPPELIVEEWYPWQPPVLEPPSYCGSPSLNAMEQEVTSWPNHPCQFLTNATAAAIAAALS